MIVLGKDWKPQAATASKQDQERIEAVAIPRIMPYSQTAVEADFGVDSKSKELEAGYTGPNYIGQLGKLMGFQLAIGAAMVGGAWILSFFM